MNPHDSGRSFRTAVVFMVVGGEEGAAVYDGVYNGVFRGVLGCIYGVCVVYIHV